MQQPPPTDPKTDLKTRCFWCGKFIVGACQYDSDLNHCFQLQKDLKKLEKQKPLTIPWYEL